MSLSTAFYEALCILGVYIAVALVWAVLALVWVAIKRGVALTFNALMKLPGGSYIALALMIVGIVSGVILGTTMLLWTIGWINARTIPV